MGKSIIITGAGGFIGEELTKYFSCKHWKVRAFVHSIPVVKVSGVEYCKYDLEKKPDQALFTNVDFLVHAAYLKYEKNNDSDQININGTKNLIDACRKNNIKPLFLSSFSAHAHAESHYGRSKMECEKLLDLSRDVILKPGFVIGKKGLCGKLIETIGRSAFFPLVGGGEQPLQSVCIDDLCSVIEKVLENNTGLFHIAEPEAITMKEFYSEIAAQLGKKLRFIPFPIVALFSISKVAEAIRVQLPVSSESVLGLKHLKTFETKQDLEKIGVVLKNYKESLRSIL
ncbi:MAG: NAD(P)-dependent oxidoreductase [Bacteroidetes bacterium]|nr:NAD(P)-dependent oxidoreductase [Bacteroidota bacterium]